MPQSGQWGAATGITTGGTAFFDLKGPTSAEIDMRMGVMVIGPTHTPLLLAGQKGQLEYGGPQYGSAPIPIGMSFGMIEKLSGPKHTWQEQTLLRNIIISGAALIAATSVTFSTTLNNTVADTKNPDAFQISTYDMLEAGNGELIWVSAMDYTTGIATIVRGYGGTTAAAITGGDKLMRAGRYWPEGSEINFKTDVNVNNRQQDYNFTTTIRTPFYMSRTAKDSLYLAQAEDMRQIQMTSLQHVMSLESSCLLSIRSESAATGSNAGLTIRTGDGLLPKMDRDKPAQVVNLLTTPTALGGTVTSGLMSNVTRTQFEAFLANFGFKAIAKSQDKYLLCSLPALLALHGWYPTTNFDRIDRDPIGDYGQVVTGLKTPYGTLRILPYQLLTDRAARNPTLANVQMFVLNSECFRTGYLKKTYLQKDIQNPSADGTGWGFLTEFMTEISGLDTHAVLKAVG